MGFLIKVLVNTKVIGIDAGVGVKKQATTRSQVTLKQTFVNIRFNA